MNDLTEVFKAASGFFRSLKRHFEDEDEGVFVGLPTLNDWDNEHPYLGDVLVKFDEEHRPNWQLLLKWKRVGGEIRFKVQLDQGTPDHPDRHFEWFDDFDEAKGQIRSILDSWFEETPRADQYGSREREARLRQDERRYA